MENKELTVITNENKPTVNKFMDEGFNLVADLTTAQTQFTSMTATTPEEKAKLFNAMNNPDERLSDNINKVIKCKDLYVETVDCVNEETGVITTCPRIVIIDEQGKSYQCVSVGIYSAFRKIIQVFGAPTWKEAVPVMVKQITKGNRKMLTLNVVK